MPPRHRHRPGNTRSPKRTHFQQYWTQVGGILCPASSYPALHVLHSSTMNVPCSLFSIGYKIICSPFPFTCLISDSCSASSPAGLRRWLRYDLARIVAVEPQDWSTRSFERDSAPGRQGEMNVEDIGSKQTFEVQNSIRWVLICIWPVNLAHRDYADEGTDRGSARTQVAPIW